MFILCPCLAVVGYLSWVEVVVIQCSSWQIILEVWTSNTDHFNLANKCSMGCVWYLKKVMENLFF